METMIATGHTWSAGGGAITLSPVLGLALTAALARSVLHLRLTALVLGACLVLGTFFAMASDAWGGTTTVAVWLVGALLIALVLRRARGPLGRNLSD